MSRKGKIVSFTVKQEMDEQIRQIADDRNLKKSQIVRQALYEYLEGSLNRPIEAALLVQISNQIEAAKDNLDVKQYEELTKTLEGIMRLK